jgi:predicted transcriptional regulator
METQNVTLAIPKEVLHRARQIAVERRTSLSAMLAQALAAIVEDEERYEAARERQIAMMSQGLDLQTQGEADWTRDSLHER